MQSKKIASVILLFTLFALLIMTTKTMIAEEGPRQINSSELSKTTVTSYLQEGMPANKNVLYCSTFQIAWDRLCDDILDEPLQLSGDPVAAKMLNERLTGEDDISEACYVAMAGYNRDNIVDEIVKALKEKFDEKPGLDLALNNPDDILAYAFLLKDLKFDEEFESLQRPIRFNGSTPVQAFGIKKYAFSKAHNKLSGQLDILDYKNDDDFIIGLRSDSPDDEIILAKVSAKSTLLETIRSVLGRISNKPPSKIREDERLNIPKLDFDVLHLYKGLMGKQFLNKGFEKHFIAKAVQSIRFRLNEKGALLKSEAAMIAPTMAPGAPPKIRNFIFDKSFLILLKEKGTQYPYFAMWVDNTELLLKEE